MTAIRKRGRPPKGAAALSAPVVIRMTPAQREKLTTLGGGAWVRERIDRARAPTDVPT